MSADTLDKLAFLTLGWLLGMLAPVVTDAIKKRRENALVKIALDNELREISYKLALASYSVNEHLGTVDRTYLQWLQGVIANYDGPNRSQTIQNITEIPLSLPDAQLAALFQTWKANKGTNIVVPKFVVPLLDARVSSLWYLENRVQILLLDIRSNINLLNELVDQAQYYNRLTFGKLENETYDRVVANLDGCRRQYAERAKIIVTKIEALGSLV